MSSVSRDDDYSYVGGRDHPNDYQIVFIMPKEMITPRYKHALVGEYREYMGARRWRENVLDGREYHNSGD